MPPRRPCVADHPDLSTASDNSSPHPRRAERRVAARLSTQGYASLAARLWQRKRSICILCIGALGVTVRFCRSAYVSARLQAAISPLSGVSGGQGRFACPLGGGALPLRAGRHAVAAVDAVPDEQHLAGQVRVVSARAAQAPASASP